MKKILLFAFMLSAGVMLFSSCAASKRGTGCPMTEKIVH